MDERRWHAGSGEGGQGAVTLAELVDLVRRGEVGLSDPAREEGGEKAVTVFDVLAQADVNETRRCPSCGEPIQLIARRCRFCSASLEPAGSSAAAVPPPPPPAASPAPAPPVAPPPIPVPAPAGPPKDLGRHLLGLPVLGLLVLVLVSLWFEPAAALGLKFLLVDVPVVLGTAILAAVEARRLGVVGDRKRHVYGPGSWFALVLLLWVVGYPAWFRKRRAHGLPDRFVAALLLALLFGAASIGGGMALRAASETRARQVAEAAAAAERAARELAEEQERQRQAEQEAARREQERQAEIERLQREIEAAEAAENAGFDVVVGCSVAGSQLPVLTCLMDSGIHVQTASGGETIDLLTLAGVEGAYTFHVPRYFRVVMVNSAESPMIQLTIQVRDRAGTVRYKDSKGAGGVINVGNEP